MHLVAQTHLRAPGGVLIMHASCVLQLIIHILQHSLLIGNHIANVLLRQIGHFFTSNQQMHSIPEGGQETPGVHAPGPEKKTDVHAHHEESIQIQPVCLLPVPTALLPTACCLRPFHSLIHLQQSDQTSVTLGKCMVTKYLFVMC